MATSETVAGPGSDGSPNPEQANEYEAAAAPVSATYRAALKAAWAAYAETMGPKPEETGITRGPSRDPTEEEAKAWAAYDAILAPATATYLAAMRELGKGRALPEIVELVELAHGEE